MNTPRRRSAFVLAALVALGAGAAACGQGEIAEADLEAAVATQLAEEVDQPEPNIDCPGPLAAEVGATTECELSVDGDDAVYPVAVEVTSVDGEQASYSVEVGTEPISGGETSGSEPDAPAEDPAEAPADGAELPGDETPGPADEGTEPTGEETGY